MHSVTPDVMKDDVAAEATAAASEWNPCDNVLGGRGVQRGVVQLYCFDG